MNSTTTRPMTVDVAWMRHLLGKQEEIDMETDEGHNPAVLFLCVHNAGRSQMAAGWLQHLADGRIDVLSAGSEPADSINPAAVEAMAEVGIDLRGREPKRWDIADLEAADVVVTMGCGDTCPVLPGKRYVDWPLADPAGRGVDAVRPIRDEIEQRIRGLMDELGVAPIDQDLAG